MNLWDKIKLLLWVKNLPDQLKGKGGRMGAKMSAMLAKLDGLKSVLGLLMIVGYYVAPHFHIMVPDVVLKVGSGLASVGLAVKLEKALGLLTKIIGYMKMALDVLQSVVNALAAKLPQPVK